MNPDTHEVHSIGQPDTIVAKLQELEPDETPTNADLARAVATVTAWTRDNDQTVGCLTGPPEQGGLALICAPPTRLAEAYEALLKRHDMVVNLETEADKGD